MFELILGQIANYRPVISRNTFVKNSTSMGSIWSAIRLHFGFEATERISLIFQKSTSSTANDLRIFTKDLSLLQDNLLRSTAYNTMEISSLKMKDWPPLWKNLLYILFPPTRGQAPDCPRGWLLLHVRLFRWSFYTESCASRCGPPRSRNLNHFMARRLHRTRTPTRSLSKLTPCLGAPLRHSSGTPSNHFRTVAPSWNYF